MKTLERTWIEGNEPYNAEEFNDLFNHVGEDFINELELDLAQETSIGTYYPIYSQPIIKRQILETARNLRKHYEGAERPWRFNKEYYWEQYRELRKRLVPVLRYWKRRYNEENPVAIDLPEWNLNTTNEEKKHYLESAFDKLVKYRNFITNVYPNNPETYKESIMEIEERLRNSLNPNTRTRRNRERLIQGELVSLFTSIQSAFEKLLTSETIAVFYDC
ncbi:MAG: hypothetical protein IK077_14880 [Thermoguttaceae bacterium]|nr:hypothetical protein [Thermoguttaceae bacterium]